MNGLFGYSFIFFGCCGQAFQLVFNSTLIAIYLVLLWLPLLLKHNKQHIDSNI